MHATHSLANASILYRPQQTWGDDGGAAVEHEVGRTIKPSTKSTAAPIHFSHSMLSLLAGPDSSASSLFAAVADNWQLLSACKT